MTIRRCINDNLIVSYLVSEFAKSIKDISPYWKSVTIEWLQVQYYLKYEKKKFVEMNQMNVLFDQYHDISQIPDPLNYFSAKLMEELIYLLRKRPYQYIDFCEERQRIAEIKNTKRNNIEIEQKRENKVKIPKVKKKRVK